MRILLIEPEYNNKYPPLGLMKIAAYHRIKGDYVTFFKGCSSELQSQAWDRIYIGTLFTFYWNKTIKTIKFYRKAVRCHDQIFVGGIMATLIKEEILKEVDVTVITGLLDKPGMLSGDKIIIDSMIPDYSILKQIDYVYPTSDAYMGYATRGCVNRCDFCAVHRLEPVYKDYLPLKKMVFGI
jgi:radical SAM superfamily enzyme YgiQ (UPF0313 family)